MAGLTKAQRAEREAAAHDEAAPDDDWLIAMVKDGETLRVHPSCVESHEAAGWSRSKE